MFEFKFPERRWEMPIYLNPDFAAEVLDITPFVLDGNAPFYFKYACSQVTIDGIWAEMGVCTGITARQIIKYMPKNKILYGFDSFEGLPEAWTVNSLRTHHKGDTFGTTPKVIPKVERMKPVVGLFEDTLPEFAKQHKQNIAFLHIDCDLYSSTKTTFDNFKDKIVSGTIIAFDEFGGYENYKQHEYKAFYEFLYESGLNFELLVWTANMGQIVVKIL